MNAHLHLDDDLASYLSEQAQREQTTLDVMLNRLLRRVLPPTKVSAETSKPSGSLVRDASTGRLVLTRDSSLPPITTEVVNDILNDLP